MYEMPTTRSCGFCGRRISRVIGATATLPLSRIRKLGRGRCQAYTVTVRASAQAREDRLSTLTRPSGLRLGWYFRRLPNAEGHSLRVNQYCRLIALGQNCRRDEHLGPQFLGFPHRSCYIFDAYE